MLKTLTSPRLSILITLIGALALVASGCAADDAATGGSGEGAADTATGGGSSSDGTSGMGDATLPPTDGQVAVDAGDDPGPDVPPVLVDTDEPTPDADDPTTDADEPTPDADEPTPDADEPITDTDEPTPDTDEPTTDADMPEEDVEDPGCIPGTVACDGTWVVVCPPDGGDWTEVLDCGEDTPCHEGACCTPTCDNAVCGDDGCGGSCGACGDGEMCSEGACACAPNCEGKNCGDDGCGGDCGACEGDDVCDAGVCTCIPDCVGAMCGDDGCGGDCGTCAADNVCTEGVCVGPCNSGETRCNGEAVEVCNPDGESWMAVATCDADAPCYDGACCAPVCDGLSCGSDGCGGSCGVCGDEDVCVDGACLPSCDEAGATGCIGTLVTLCSADEIQEPLLDCSEFGQTCEGGECVDIPIPPAECPEVCVGATIEAGLCALDICYEDFFESAEVSSPTGSDVTGAWSAMEQYGSAENDLVPQAPPSYLALATGDLLDLTHQSKLVGTIATADPFSSDGYNMHDSVEFTLTLTAPPNVTGFSLDSLFMSVEYEEWIGTTFNDKLYLLVNAPISTGGQQKVINYAACSNAEQYFDFENADGKWCYIAINTAYSEPCSDWTTDLAGTGFSCPEGSTTGWLRTTHPIEPGESFTLTLHIHDTSDQVYDSAALFDNFQWLLGDVVHETVPIDAVGCVPTCGDKVCGDDGCAGSCGECDEDAYCDEAGQCSAATACEGDNPAGCAQNGCPEGQVCDTSEQQDVCPSSACECDPATGQWVCTPDCGGGVCVEADVPSIRVELTWDTPGDEDQTDTGPEAGSDMDLHFTHPNASGDDGLGWFDSPWDCFWFNPTPDWGDDDPTVNDNPIMVIDDTDGAGPELIELEVPEDGMAYRIGVHYWADHDFGVSMATVKVWIDGVLTDTMTAALEDRDMWEVATIEWPSGTVIPLLTNGGQPMVISDYEANGFGQ